MPINLWSWLSEAQGQHAAAVQAIATVAFGLPTLAFLITATLAAYRQAEAARKQTIVAEFQAKIAFAQTRIQYEQQRAIDDEKFPELSVEWEYSMVYFGDSPRKRLDFKEIKNRGAGSAYRVSLRDGDETLLETDEIEPGRSERIRIAPLLLAEDLVLTYSSSQGSTVICELKLAGDDHVSQSRIVKRSYSIDDLRRLSET